MNQRENKKVLKQDLQLVVVSREGCHRCETIQAVAKDYGIPIEVVYFSKGGADMLAMAKFIPIIMPAIIGYRYGQVVHRWNGVSEFLEAMEDIE